VSPSDPPDPPGPPDLPGLFDPPDLPDRPACPTHPTYPAYNSAVLRPFRGVLPRVASSAFIDDSAQVIGDVEIGDESSVWMCAVVRGDVNLIRIGRRSNVQDGAVVHAMTGTHQTSIGDNVTIGHAAVIHACTIEDACLIGMHSTILDGAIVRRHAMIGAGALVAPGKVVGEGELWLGNPARCVRKLSDKDIEQLYYSAQHYVRLKDKYL